MINIILAEPKGEENIGSTARAMLNFGVEDLTLVNPSGNHLSETSFNYAIHARKILEKAEIFPDLKSALVNGGLNIAISRRTGNYRRKDFDLKDLSEFLKDYKDKKVNLVFGREANGLTNDEIMLCDVICSINTSDKFPSVNLSHSVILVLHEIYNYSANEDSAPASIPAERKNFDEMIDQIYSTLSEIDFYKNPQPETINNYIRKILIRARLEDYDTRLIKNVFKSISGIVKRKKN
jgi:tRNA/rRNA methyltransferase